VLPEVEEVDVEIKSDDLRIERIAARRIPQFLYRW